MHVTINSDSVIFETKKCQIEIPKEGFLGFRSGILGNEEIMRKFKETEAKRRVASESMKAPVADFSPYSDFRHHRNLLDGVNFEYRREGFSIKLAKPEERAELVAVVRRKKESLTIPFRQATMFMLLFLRDNFVYDDNIGRTFDLAQ